MKRTRQACPPDGRSESKEDPQRDVLQHSNIELGRDMASASSSTSVNTSASVRSSSLEARHNGSRMELAGASLSEFHSSLDLLRQAQQPRNQSLGLPSGLNLAGNFATHGVPDRLRLSRNLQVQQLLAYRDVPNQGQAGGPSSNAASRMNRNLNAALAGLPDAALQRLLLGRAIVNPHLPPAPNSSFNQSRPSLNQYEHESQKQQEQLRRLTQLHAASSLPTNPTGPSHGLSATDMIRLSRMGGVASVPSIASTGHPGITPQNMFRGMFLPRGLVGGLALPTQGFPDLASGVSGSDRLGIPALSTSGIPEHLAQVRLDSFVSFGSNEQTSAERDVPRPAAAAPLPCIRPSRSPEPSSDGSNSGRKRKARAFQKAPMRRKRRSKDPVVMDGVPHHTDREFVALGIAEDPNWLSEFQCLVRNDLMEVIGATSSKSVLPDQVGVRCRYCAHLAPGSRVCRSSAFPSSLDKLYQSFSMMVRDHFGKCPAVPREKALEFQTLKQKNSQGATDSKHYWVYAAQKLGMVDAGSGIQRTQESIKQALQMPPYGASIEANPNDGCAQGDDEAEESPSLVCPEDQARLTPFLYELMRHLRLVHLLPSERVGKRKGLPVGLEGMGCQYCFREGRLGFSRCFPLRRRALPSHVLDLYHHCLRCPLCPEEVKEHLKHASQRDNETFTDQSPASADAYAIIWAKLGRQRDLTTS
jgi:hypothetical protein